MASTEDIEAKLCAYVEGELDPADRADIERHLAANPHHRVLLAELSRTRQLVQALPREAAPEEIIDAVQSQLERSVLLSDIDESSASSAMRMHRWPQYMAVAAIVLLTAGLGIVIFFVLPRSQQMAIEQFALEGASGTQPVDPGPSLDDDVLIDTTTLDATPPTGAGDRARSRAAGRSGGFELAKADDATASRPGVASKGLATGAAEGETLEGDALATAAGPETKSGDLPAAAAMTPALTTPAAPDAGALAGRGWDERGDDIFARSPAAAATAQPVPSKGGAVDPASRHLGAFDAAETIDVAAVQERLRNADLARQLKDSPVNLNDNSLFLQVSTADTRATQSQVSEYFATNNIRFEELPQPPPAPLQISESQVVMMSRQAPDPTVRLKGGPAVGSPPAPVAQDVAPKQEKAGADASAAEREFRPQQAAPTASDEHQQLQRPWQAQEGAPAARQESAVASGQSVARQELSRDRSVLQQQESALTQAEAPSTLPSEAVTDSTMTTVPPAGTVSGDGGQSYESRFNFGEQSRQVAVPQRAGKLIVARGLTRRQAVALQQSLNQQPNTYAAKLYDEPLVAGQPADAAGVSAPSLYGRLLTNLGQTPEPVVRDGSRGQVAALGSQSNAANAPAAQPMAGALVRQEQLPQQPIDGPQAPSSVEPTATPAAPGPDFGGEGAADGYVDLVIVVNDPEQQADLMGLSPPPEPTPAPAATQPLGQEFEPPAQVAPPPQTPAVDVPDAPAPDVANPAQP